jgi:anti-sigma factor RsiW
MQHLDEGTIHAWLDGELPPAEGEALEAHIAECEQCAAAVAEARGFVAASSRILTALDTVPGGVLPGASTGSGASLHPARRRFVTSRAWMAVAAVLVLSTVTVVAIKPHGDTAQLRVAAAARDEQELPASAAPSEAKTPATKPTVEPQAVDSYTVGAAAAGARVSRAPSPTAAPATANAFRKDAPAPMQSHAAAPADESKPVDQTERLRSRLEAERKSTRVRPSEGAPPAMADAAQPARVDEPSATADRSLELPTTPPAAPVKNDLVKKREVAVSEADSISVQRDRAGARGVTISGRVTNAAGAPLASAQVHLDRTNIGVITNDDGTYALVIPPARANGKALSLVARQIGYRSAAVLVAPDSAPIMHDFVLASNPLTLGQVVVTGEGTTEKLGKAVAADSSALDISAPQLVSRNTSSDGADTVVTMVYNVGGATVSLIDRSHGSDTRQRVQIRGMTSQSVAKVRDTVPRINSITWSDSSGHSRTLRGAVSREDLERIRMALFGATP